jgi:hypothetical protein
VATVNVGGHSKYEMGDRLVANDVCQTPEAGLAPVTMMVMTTATESDGQPIFASTPCLISEPGNRSY